MELVDVLKIAIGIIGVLVLTFCGAVWSEIKKLRHASHAHGNRLAELGMAMGIVCQKIGLNRRTYEDEE